MNAEAGAANRRNDGPERARDIVDAWCARDEARALHHGDRALVAVTAAARTLIVELASAPDATHDLFSACGVYGYLLGKDGGSPSFAASTLDGLREALGAQDPPWLLPARSAVLEGYVAARLDTASLEAKRRWDYPACSVPLGHASVAIVAGYPDSDGEDLADWAARVARGVVADGLRRARIAGDASASTALAEALSLVGVHVASSPLPATSPRGWLRWLRRA